MGRKETIIICIKERESRSANAGWSFQISLPIWVGNQHRRTLWTELTVTKTMIQKTAGGRPGKSKRGTGSTETNSSLTPENHSLCQNGPSASELLENLLGIESNPGGPCIEHSQLLLSGSGPETKEEHSRPLVIELFAGSFGWSVGFIAEGFRSVGFDIEHQDYHGPIPEHASLVLKDVLELNGAWFKNAACLVCSPPCQEYSYMAMPWSRAKAIAAEYRNGKRDVKKLTALFDACFRIQREAIEAAGHFIPMVVENVRGAQPWVGHARWAFGSFFLWGDVPALMPITMPRKSKPKINSPQMWKDRDGGHWNGSYGAGEGLKLPGNNGPRRWDEREVQGLCDAGKAPSEGFKTQGMNWSDRSLRGQDFTRIAGQQAEPRRISEAHRSKSPAKGYGIVTEDGTKSGHWFGDGGSYSPMAMMGSKSNARKAASATIAKIPLALARWIAKVYYPRPPK